MKHNVSSTAYHQQLYLVNYKLEGGQVTGYLKVLLILYMTVYFFQNLSNAKNCITPRVVTVPI